MYMSFDKYYLNKVFIWVFFILYFVVYVLYNIKSVNQDQFYIDKQIDRNLQHM